MGLDESEFWLSTYAKIKALEDAQEIQDKRRDFFPAFLISLGLNQLNSEDGKVYTPQDILEFQYSKTPSVNFTPEPKAEMGAYQSNWREAKAFMKGK